MRIAITGNALAKAYIFKNNEHYNLTKKNNTDKNIFENQVIITPNSMQIEALKNLKNLRKGNKK